MVTLLYYVVILLFTLIGGLGYMFFVERAKYVKSLDKMNTVAEGVSRLVNTSVKGKRMEYPEASLFKGSQEAFNTLMGKSLYNILWKRTSEYCVTITLPQFKFPVLSEIVFKWLFNWLKDTKSVNIGSSVFNVIQNGWKEGDYTLENLNKLMSSKYGNNVKIVINMGNAFSQPNLGPAFPYAFGETGFEEVWNHVTPKVISLEADSYNTKIITNLFISFYWLKPMGK